MTDTTKTEAEIRLELLTIVELAAKTLWACSEAPPEQANPPGLPAWRWHRGALFLDDRNISACGAHDLYVALPRLADYVARVLDTHRQMSGDVTQRCEDACAALAKLSPLDPTLARRP